MTVDSPAQTHPKGEVIVLTGIPGSGKSTLVRERFPKYKRINLDTLKTRGREASEILSSLERLESIIVDNTNTTRQGRKKYIEIARAYGVMVRSIYLDTPLAIALKRNALRKGRERVPNGAIARFQRILEPPSLDEGFDTVEVIHALQNIEETIR